MTADGGPVPDGAGPLLHLALADDWEAARKLGAYDRSTIGRSLAEEGFIHCSFASQVQDTADRYYRGRSDVVLMRIDPTGLDVRVEPVPGGARFPHVYEPIPVAAVLRVDPVPLGDDGRLEVGDALAG